METIMIGSRIAEARKRMNYSQSQLAERLFISPQAVGKWERGESIPDIITCIRLAKLLGVDLNYFSEDFASEGNEVKREVVQQEEATAKDEKKTKTPWDMSRWSWVGADFSGLSNLHEKFSSSNMRNCLFVGSDMTGLRLTGNHVDGCDFSGSLMPGSQLERSHLVNNKFKDCQLGEAIISSCHIQNCQFIGADLTGVVFKSCHFRKNSMVDALLKRTAFSATHLADIEFSGSIDDCTFENCSFSRVSFRDAVLINTFFKSRRLRQIQFIDCQADRLTYEFLKNGKADVKGITVL
jgi:uncharacterized protein YjbI with pentapeptide repeats